MDKYEAEALAQILNALTAEQFEVAIVAPDAGLYRIVSSAGWSTSNLHIALGYAGAAAADKSGE